MFCGAACNEQVVFGIILGKQSSRALATIMCTKLLLVRCYSIVFRVVQIIVNTFQLGWPFFLVPTHLVPVYYHSYICIMLQYRKHV